MFALPSCQVPLPSSLQHPMLGKKKVQFSYIQQTCTDHTYPEAFCYGPGCGHGRFGQHPFPNSFQRSKVKSS